MLPFTRADFVAVFVNFNRDLWPVQLAALVLGATIVAALLAGDGARTNSRTIAAGLAAMWLVTGIGYHAAYFAAINPLAWVFAALFVAEGLLLLQAGVWRTQLAFDSTRRRGAWLGWGFVAYALVFYPAIGLALGQRWEELPAFGLTPCPVTLFCCGLWLLAAPPLPRRLLVIPLLWSLIGGSAALLLSMPQDWALLAAAATLAAQMRSQRTGAGDAPHPPRRRTPHAPPHQQQR